MTTVEEDATYSLVIRKGNPGIVFLNRPFPIFKTSHFQNAAWCKTFLVKMIMSFICKRIKHPTSHLASLWNRGLGQLENGLGPILL